MFYRYSPSILTAGPAIIVYELRDAFNNLLGILMKHRMPALLNIQHRELREMRLHGLDHRWAIKRLLVRANDIMHRVPLLAEREQRSRVHFPHDHKAVADRRRAAHHATPEPLRLDRHVVGRREEHVGELPGGVFGLGGGESFGS